MKSLIIERYGDISAFKIKEMPVPTVTKNQVLIRVSHAGLNPIDYKMREGKLRLFNPLRFPQIMGSEVSGVVEEIGDEVTKFRKGEFVYCRLDKDRMGGFAEFVSANEDIIALKPETLDFATAAGVPLVGLTAWQVIYDHAHLSRDNKILVQAGAGSVGFIASQLAKRIGAHVFTTVSDRGIHIVEEIDVDHVINYKTQDLDRFKNNFDVIFDTVGEQTLINSMKLLKREGRIFSISGIPTPNTADYMGYNTFCKVLFWFASYKLRKLAKSFDGSYEFVFMKPDGNQLEIIAKLIDKKELKVRQVREFHFEEHHFAFRLLESGEARSKLVFKIGDNFP